MNATVATLPASHLDLLDRPLPAALTTHLASGRLQSTVVWYWRDGNHLMLSTMAEFHKTRNLRARPLATLLVTEPDGARRWVEARCTVAAEEGDAPADLDALAVRYTGASPYFGSVVPAALAQTEHPVTFRLVPHTVATGPTPVMPSVPPRPGTAAHDVVPDEGALPASHLDLFDHPGLGALSTRMPDGSATTQPARCRRDGTAVVCTTTGHRTRRDLLADPRATVLVVDPADSSRWIEVRGDAVAHAGLDDDAVEVRIQPVRVTCDAIHR